MRSRSSMAAVESAADAVTEVADNDDQIQLFPEAPQPVGRPHGVRYLDDAARAGWRAGLAWWTGHVHQGHRTRSPALLPELPSPWRGGADVAGEGRGRATVGEGYPPTDLAARDAALGHR